MITEIVTHFRPHADELVALMLLRNFPEGEEKFPGVSTAKISFLFTGSLPEGKSAYDFPEKIFLGVGGGMFDEHATDNKERVEDETCLTLVAKYLGLDKDINLERIIYFVKQDDLQGSKVKDGLSVMIKFLHSCYKDDVEKIYKWVETAYLAEYKKDKSFLESIKDLPNFEDLFNEFKNKWQAPTYSSSTLCLEEQGYKDLNEWKSFMEKALKYQDDQYKDAVKKFDTEAKKETFIAKDGKPLTMAVITSDNEEMNKASRTRVTDVTIIFNSRGNVGIFTYHKRMIDLTKVFILLRMAEQYYRGEIKIKDEKELSKEGMVENIPWYLIASRNAGYNGSLTTKDIEPTKIPKEKIIELVKEGLK
ncbi:MAG: hypothetical protein WCF92_03715 [bacterium]